MMSQPEPVKSHTINFQPQSKMPAVAVKGGPSLNADAPALAPIPTKPTTAWGLRQYYEKHEDLILEEVRKFGAEATQKRWGISNKAFANLTAQNTSRGMPPLPLLSKALEEEARAYVVLPVFKDDWSPEVQLRWFDAFIELCRKPVTAGAR